MKRLLLLGLLLGLVSPALGATLLPPGKNCFGDANGASLGLGTVTFYVPTTTTFKNTWVDAGESTLNTNPVQLGGDGCAIIYGSGTYRQIVKDLNGNTIWDLLTASTGASTGVLLYGGTSTGSANVQLIAPTGFSATDGQLVSFIAGLSNSGAMTLNAGTGAIPVRYDSVSGPVALTGGEVVANNAVEALYVGGFFHLIGPPSPVQYQYVSNYQAFTTSGTWTKPALVSTGSQTHIQCWGSGGGGGANATAGGGGGGGYLDRWLLTSSLGATETVTIPAGGAINTAGTDATFGSWVTACGGGHGQNAATGSGGGGGGESIGLSGASTTCRGGDGSAAGTGGNGGGPVGGFSNNNPMAQGFSGGAGGDNNVGNSGGGSAFYGGGGGGSGNGAIGGGPSVWGGGGGTGGGGGAGGVSLYAGAGGATTVVGSAPSGGGGRNAAGGRGECRVTVFP